MLIKGEQVLIGQTSNKQKELIAGSNISLTDDLQTGKTIISATGGGSGTQYINMYERGVLIRQLVDEETISIPIIGDNIVGLEVEFDNKQYIIIFNSPTYRDASDNIKWRDITSNIIPDLLDYNITFEWIENTGSGGGMIINITTMDNREFDIYGLYQKEKTQP